MADRLTRRRDRARKAAHNAAYKILRNHESEGQPYVLYLRSYSPTQVVWTPEAGPIFTTDEHLVAHLPPGIGVVSVEDRGDVITGASRGGGATTPTLVLRDEDWQTGVSELIERADLLVVQCFSLSAGVEWELATCAALGKLDQTVVLLPPPEPPFDRLDREPLIQRFPRCVWWDEAFTPRFVDHFFVADLVARMSSIAAQPRVSRAHLADPATRLREYPVTYNGVIAGYKERIGKYADLSEDEDWWYRKYWSESRAIGIVHLQLTRHQMSFEAVARDLLYLYSALAADMLRAGPRGTTTIFQGDVDIARTCVESAHAVLDRLRRFGRSDPWLGVYADLIKTLGLQVRAIDRLMLKPDTTFVAETRVHGLPWPNAIPVAEIDA